MKSYSVFCPSLHTFHVGSRNCFEQKSFHTICPYSLSTDPASSLQLIERSKLTSAIQQWVHDYYLPIARETSDPAKALHLAAQFRLLCCVRQRPEGVEMLNEAIEQAIKRRLGISIEQRHFHGQLLMVTQNMPSVGLFNGDVGVVWNSPQAGMRIAFLNADQATIRFLDLNRITAFERVFAMTVHKSQGSEFEHVGLLLPRATPHELLSNALIYTAITRAKQSLYLFSDKAQFIDAIQRDGERWSGLKPI